MAAQFITLVRDSDDAVIIINTSSISYIIGETAERNEPMTSVVYLTEAPRTYSVRVRHSISELRNALNA